MHRTTSKQSSLCARISSTTTEVLAAYDRKCRDAGLVFDWPDGRLTASLYSFKTRVCKTCLPMIPARIGVDLCRLEEVHNSAARTVRGIYAKSRPEPAGHCRSGKTGICLENFVPAKEPR